MRWLDLVDLIYAAVKVKLDPFQHFTSVKIFSTSLFLAQIWWLSLKWSYKHKSENILNIYICIYLYSCYEFLHTEAVTGQIYSHLLVWICHLPVWVGPRRTVVLGNLGTVQATKWCVTTSSPLRSAPQEDNGWHCEVKQSWAATGSHIPGCSEGGVSFPHNYLTDATEELECQKSSHNPWP